MKLIIYTDGGCYPNPGTMGIGVVMKQDGKTVKQISKNLGRGTNNIAEYEAVITALEEAKAMKATSVTIFTDSALVEGQLIHGWEVNKEHLKKLNKKATELMDEFEEVNIEYEERESNKEAHKLSVRAIFGKKK